MAAEILPSALSVWKVRRKEWFPHTIFCKEIISLFLLISSWLIFLSPAPPFFALFHFYLPAHTLFLPSIEMLDVLSPCLLIWELLFLIFLSFFLFIILPPLIPLFSLIPLFHSIFDVLSWVHHTYLNSCVICTEWAWEARQGIGIPWPAAYTTTTALLQETQRQGMPIFEKRNWTATSKDRVHWAQAGNKRDRKNIPPANPYTHLDICN
jgi:hypothetical protein